MTTSTNQEVKLGPIWLNQGITKTNALTFFLASFFTVGMISFMSFMQPYVLSENLKIAVEQQGTATSILTFSYEVVMLLLVAPIGALADKIGRRPIYTIGFLWIACAFVIFPLADNLFQLVIARLFFAGGAAAVASMMGTVLADYPQNKTRGFMVAMSGLANGMGALLLIFGLSQLPIMFKEMGYDAIIAGRYTYMVAAGLCIVTAIIVFNGLSKINPGKAKTEEHSDEEQKKIVDRLKEGIQEAKKNPRLGVACISAFIARGDVMVVSTFFSLWAIQHGISQGLSSGEATQVAGEYYRYILGATLVWGPIWGIMLDKMDRLTSLALAMALATVGYLWVGFSPNPTTPEVIPALIMLGIGEFSVILGGITLVGQEAPEKMRGSVVGLFNFTGSAGILTMSVVGGLVFDAWMPGAPFVIVGLINLFIFIIALSVRLKVGYKAPKSGGAVAAH